MRGLGYGLTVVIISLVTGAVMYFKPSALGLNTPDAGVGAALGLILTTILFLALRPVMNLVRSTLAGRQFQSHQPKAAGEVPAEDPRAHFRELHAALKERYGRAWRRVKPFVVVLGSESELKEFFPGLERGWAETPEAVLVAGSPEVPEAAWPRLCGRPSRPPRAVLALAGDQASAERLGARLSKLATALGFYPPAYLLFKAREIKPFPQAGLLLDEAGSLDEKAFLAKLASLSNKLADDGVRRLKGDLSADSEAALSAWLEKEGPRLAASARRFRERLPLRQALRGAFFTGAAEALRPDEKRAPLGALLADAKSAPRRQTGFRPFDYAIGLVILGLALWLVSLPVSYLHTANQIDLAVEIFEALKPEAGVTAHGAAQKLLALQEELLARERTQTPATWRAALRLRRDEGILAGLWRLYGREVNHWLAAPALADMAASLDRLNESFRRDSLAPSDEEIFQAYETLKAYLMLGRPERAEPEFLAARLAPHWVAPGLSNAEAAKIAEFYAGRLAAHPGWAEAADPPLVERSRQTLLNLIGLKRVDDRVYQAMLDDAAAKYPPLTLTALLAGHDFSAVWTCQEKLPGVYTRQAWDGHIKEAIERLGAEDMNTGDWVLTDSQSEIAPEESLELQGKLSARYFSDYTLAWQRFLGGIRWVRKTQVQDIAEQLKNYADPGRSPLPALIKTLAWNARAGEKVQTIGEGLVAKTKGIFGGEDSVPPPPSEEGRAAPPPLLAFEPFIRMTEGGTGGAGSIGLGQYLDRVTGARLKLEQIASSVDPEAMARQLAQTAFQGRGNDMNDSRGYGALVAASLGAGWGAAGEQLFVEPLDSAWVSMLDSTVSSLNSLWRAGVLAAWQEEFTGYYPFYNSPNDASIPALNRFLNSQTGMLAKFINHNLSGVLELQGDEWTVNPLFSQSLKINPEFIGAINRLTRVSAHLYSQGDARYVFDLLPVSSPGLEESQVIINGQVLRNVNNKPEWQTMIWPGDPLASRARLLWRGTASGLNLENDFAGRWGFLRMLEKASVVEIDAARYQLEWKLPDKKYLRCMLRPEAGAGPLELLELRGFTMPETIFLNPRTNRGTAKKAAKK